MATSNLALATHTDGTKVKDSDIRVGLVVVYPSPVGGELNYQCVTVTPTKATFCSLDCRWPIGFYMEFDQAEFTPKDFALLAHAISAIARGDRTVMDGQYKLVRRAHELDYARITSRTQAQWTEMGVMASRYKTHAA